MFFGLLRQEIGSSHASNAQCWCLMHEIGSIEPVIHGHNPNDFYAVQELPAGSAWFFGLSDRNGDFGSVKVRYGAATPNTR